MPGGQDNKCFVGMPFQEDECASVDGVCGDVCACNGEALHGLCPSQPNAIKCCPKNSTINKTCSTEPSQKCKAQSGYCGNPESCKGTVLDNLCPGGQDNKCCKGMPFQVNYKSMKPPYSSRVAQIHSGFLLSNQVQALPNRSKI